MTRYRIYTQDCPDLEPLALTTFSGATLLRGVGLFEGRREPSAVIELLTPDDAFTSVRISQFAETLRSLNHQAQVLVTWESVAVLSLEAHTPP